MQDKFLTIWKDGSYQVCGALDAEYYGNDEDFLININLCHLMSLNVTKP